MTHRVLVIGPAWVGDMIMSQVIYSALRDQHDDLSLDVLAPRATVSLVQRMPEVDRGILIDQKHGQLGLSYRRGLGHLLRENQYDQAIVTQNSLKSALVPFFADVPQRTGFLGEYRYFLLNDIRFLDKKRLPLMTDRFLALVGKTGDEIKNPRLTTDKDNLASLVQRHKLTLEEPVVGFCPGAEFGDAKKWPESHYASLGRSLVESGKQVWIFGGPADSEVGESIAEAVGPGCRNLAGKTSLIDAIDLISTCQSVVTNDSGLMHVAASVGVKVVALYGSTSPGFTPPLTESAEIVRLGLSCSPCFKRVCPLGHKDCLNKLEPAQVISVL